MVQKRIGDQSAFLSITQGLVTWMREPMRFSQIAWSDRSSTHGQSTNPSGWPRLNPP